MLALFMIPAEITPHSLLGYSASRWLLLTYVAAGVLAFCALLFILRRVPGRMTWLRERLERGLSGWGYWIAFLASALGVLLGLLFLYTYSGLTNKQVIPLFVRLMPVMLWFSFLCLEALVYLIWFGRGEARLSLRATLGDVLRALWMRRLDLAAVFLLSVAILLVFTPVFRSVAPMPGSDFTAHVRQAQRMEETRVNESSYFLYQFLVIAVHMVFKGVDYLSAGIWVVVAFQIFLGWTLYAVLRWGLRRAFERQPAWACVISAFFAFCLLLITPLNIITWQGHHLYFGYIGINVYHNPTSVLLKPLALLVFLAAVAVFSAGEERAKPNGRSVLPFWIIAGITLLCTLAKPNFVIAFLPALGVMALLWLWRREKIDWPGLVGGIVLPAVGLLAWQYLATYSSNRVIVDEAGIAFAPFLVYGRESNNLLLKFFLSIAFPLVVYLLYYRRARQDWSLNLAWLTFGAGAIFTYFFAESGTRMQDANFAWSGQVTLFILYTVSTAFFLGQVFDRRSTNQVHKKFFPFLFSSAIFVLQLVCGILWYGLHLIQPGNAWW
jgi:hypothetical protein